MTRSASDTWDAAPWAVKPSVRRVAKVPRPESGREVISKSSTNDAFF